MGAQNGDRHISIHPRNHPQPNPVSVELVRLHDGLIQDLIPLPFPKLHPRGHLHRTLVPGDRTAGHFQAQQTG